MLLLRPRINQSKTTIRLLYTSSKNDEKHDGIIGSHKTQDKNSILYVVTAARR